MLRIGFLLLILMVSPIFAATNLSGAYAYQLKNGLRLYVKPNHRASVVTTQVWYKVGSSYEPSGLTGISHVLEHMMFQGTPSVPAGKFSSTIIEHGGTLNATTSRDYTNYFEILPAQYLDLSLKLEADRMQHLQIDQARFDKEINVVKEERRMRTENNPISNTNERFNAAAFVASPYHHPVVGWMDDLNRLTVKDLEHWYQTWYGPNNAIVIVAGDVKPQQVYKAVEQYFGSIPNHPAYRVIPTAQTKPLGKRVVNVELPATVPLLAMGYSVPVIKTADKSWQPYALLVLSQVLGGGDGARLNKVLVRQQQLAASVGVFYNPYSRLNGQLSCWLFPVKPDAIAALEKSVQEQIQLLKTKPISSEELSRVKHLLIANKVYSQDALLKQAFSIGELVSVGLPWQLNAKFSERIQAVTVQQVQQVAQTFLINKGLTVAILHPLPMTAEDRRKATKGGAHAQDLH